MTQGGPFGTSQTVLWSAGAQQTGTGGMAADGQSSLGCGACRVALARFRPHPGLRDQQPRLQVQGEGRSQDSDPMLCSCALSTQTGERVPTPGSTRVHMQMHTRASTHAMSGVLFNSRQAPGSQGLSRAVAVNPERVNCFLDNIHLAVMKPRSAT